MLPALSNRLVRWCLVALAATMLAALPAAADALVIRGTLRSVSGAPIAGAAVQAIRLPSGPAVSGGSDAQGAFTIACPGPGSYVVFAAATGFASRQTDPVSLAEGDVSLDLILTETRGSPPAPRASNDEAGVVVPNPVLAHIAGHAITLRLLGLLMAIGATLGAVMTVVLLGRRMGFERRSLSRQEAADFVVNAHRPLGELKQEARALGARGAGWSFRIDEDVMRDLVAHRRHGLIFASLLAPTLIAIAVLGGGTAMLIGQPAYLFAGVLLVAAGFVFTPFFILWRARRGRHSPPSPGTR